MATITQAQRDDLAKQGLIDGETPKREMTALKKPVPVAPAATLVAPAATPAPKVQPVVVDPKMGKYLEQASKTNEILTQAIDTALMKQDKFAAEMKAAAKNPKITGFTMTAPDGKEYKVTLDRAT